MLNLPKQKMNASNKFRMQLVSSVKQIMMAWRTAICLGLCLTCWRHSCGASYTVQRCNFHLKYK